MIGAFQNIDDGTGTKEKRLKLIRDESIGSYSWDTSDSSVNSGYGVNEWSQADVMKLLNPGYLTEEVGGSLYYYGKSGNCYNGASNAYGSCEFTTTGLKDDLKKLIGNTVWNIGSINDTDNTTILVSKFYENERGNIGGKKCTSGIYCNDTVERTTSWIGKVGLIYPSDYGYATSGSNKTKRTNCLNKELYNWNDDLASYCKNNDWIRNKSGWQWTITPMAHSINARYVFRILWSGTASNTYSHTTGNTYPTVYLKSSVKISSGIGSKSNPYILSES